MKNGERNGPEIGPCIKNAYDASTTGDLKAESGEVHRMLFWVLASLESVPSSPISGKRGDRSSILHAVGGFSLRGAARRVRNL